MNIEMLAVSYACACGIVFNLLILLDATHSEPGTLQYVTIMIFADPTFSYCIREASAFDRAI